MSKKDRGHVFYPTDGSQNIWLQHMNENKQQRKHFLKEMMLEMYSCLLTNRAKVKFHKYLQHRAKTMKPHIFYVERDRASKSNVS